MATYILGRAYLVLPHGTVAINSFVAAWHISYNQRVSGGTAAWFYYLSTLLWYIVVQFILVQPHGNYDFN